MKSKRSKICNETTRLRLLVPLKFWILWRYFQSMVCKSVDPWEIVVYFVKLLYQEKLYSSSYMHFDILKTNFLVLTLLASEQALLFGRAKRVSRERTSEPLSPRGAPLSRLLSRVSRATSFHNIPQMENLLAGYDTLNVPHWDEPTKAAGNFRKNPVVSSAKYCHLSCPWKTQASRTLFEANKLL